MCDRGTRLNFDDAHGEITLLKSLIYIAVENESTEPTNTRKLVSAVQCFRC